MYRTYYELVATKEMWYKTLTKVTVKTAHSETQICRHREFEMMNATNAFTNRGIVFGFWVLKTVVSTDGCGNLFYLTLFICYVYESKLVWELL